MGNNNYTKYDEDFKNSLVSLHQNGKTLEWYNINRVDKHPKI